MARNDPTEIDFYEGLVRKTASMYVDFTEEEYEDVCQILRIKAWRALGTFDSTRSKLPVERYVFSCMKNQVKDLLKKKKRNEAYIEDFCTNGDGGQRRDEFENQYLRMDEEAALDGLLADVPLIPSTLDLTERKVLALLYMDYGQAEIALSLDTTKREVAVAVKGLKEKMADWKPSNGSLPIKAPLETSADSQLAA